MLAPHIHNSRPFRLLQRRSQGRNIFVRIAAAFLEFEAVYVNALHVRDDLPGLRLIGVLGIEKAAGELEHRLVQRHIDSLVRFRSQPLERPARIPVLRERRLRDRQQRKDYSETPHSSSNLITSAVAPPARQFLEYSERRSAA